MAVNNFKPFGVGKAANVSTQADYEALPALDSGFSAGKASSAQINKALRQGTVMSSVLAQFIANLSGKDVLDDGNTQAVLDNLSKALNISISQVTTGVIGTTRNASMAVPIASTIAKFVADELIFSNKLAGSQYRIGSFNKTINLAINGVGGMDIGAAPSSGYVGVYAIFNPTTGISALLAVDATSTKVPEIYSGVNMPPGYSVSALVAVWPVSSGMFVIGTMYDRKVDISSRMILSSSVVNPSRVSLFTTAFPLNAKFIYGGFSISSTAASDVSLTIWGCNNAVGGMAMTNAVTANGAYSSTYSKISVVDQTIGWSSGNSSGTPTYGIGLGSYEF